MKLQPPPHYANIPAGLLFDQDLPDSIFRTLAQLHGLAWRSKGERTPPATVLELATLRGLKERRMYDHLRELKDAGLIRVENLGDGRIVIHPLRWAGDAGAVLSVTSLTPAELEELAIPKEPTAKLCSTTAKLPNHVVVVGVDDPVGQKQQQHNLVPATAKLCSSTAKDCSNALAESLMALGITEGVALELVASRAPEQVEGWIAYAQQAGNLRDKAAFVVAKLRGGENPPKVMTEEQRDEARRMRYIEGKYAEFIQH
jgi:hypothetical protein